MARLLILYFLVEILPRKKIYPYFRRSLLAVFNRSFGARFRKRKKKKKKKEKWEEENYVSLSKRTYNPNNFQIFLVGTFFSAYTHPRCFSNFLSSSACFELLSLAAVASFAPPRLRPPPQHLAANLYFNFRRARARKSA